MSLTQMHWQFYLLKPLIIRIEELFVSPKDDNETVIKSEPKIWRHFPLVTLIRGDGSDKKEIQLESYLSTSSGQHLA